MLRTRRSVIDRWRIVTAAGLVLFALLTFWRFHFPQETRLERECRVQPRFLTPSDYDAPEPNGTVPKHVFEFEALGVVLPKYEAHELLLVSVSSNNTYQRQIAQNYTFGRIFDLMFVTDDDFPNCVLCNGADLDDACHCPSFRTPCRQHVFHERSTGWWCATRKALAAIEVALDRWEQPELPKWLHLLDDNTWVNPVSERLIIENLNPDAPHFIGDDFGGFIAGGPGMLMSRAALQKLLGPPKHPKVSYNWQNGTHSIYVESQLGSCIARMQGGDWCYFHGDWALTECLQEVNVPYTDLGSLSHGAFFSQLAGDSEINATWFGVSPKIAPLLRRTHSAALHIQPEEMYDIFYTCIVPYYQNLFGAFKRGDDSD